MKTKKHNVKVGDILYSVDPQKLVIKRSSITEIDNGYGCVITINSSYYFNKTNDPVWIPIEIFPIETKNLLYFKSEDEAERFIKTQIGVF